MKTLARSLVLLVVIAGTASAKKPETAPAAPAPTAAPQASDPEATPPEGKLADPLAEPPLSTTQPSSAAPAVEPAGAVQAQAHAPAHDRGAVLVGLKAGVLLAEPFTAGRLGPSFLVDVELGYNLPFVNRAFAVLLDAGYTQPEASGTQTDPRVDTNSGGYSWSLTQREVMLGLTVMYRATFIGEGKVVPYVGVGPRLWLLQTTVRGAAGTNPINESQEQSAKVGFHVPLGVDYLLGPGRIFVEAQLLWAPLDHRTTGDSSVGSITAEFGYRLFL